MKGRRGELAHPINLQSRRNSLRLQNWDYFSPGPYFFTTCTFGRKEIFCSEAIRSEAIEMFRRIARESKVNIHTIVIADNHIHGLITLPGDKRINIWNYIGKAKVRITQAITHGQASLPLQHKIWQRSFYDHVIRDEHDFFEKAQYIENHPVKEKGSIYTEWH